MNGKEKIAQLSSFSLFIERRRIVFRNQDFYLTVALPVIMQADFVPSRSCQILTSAPLSTFLMVFPVTSSALDSPRSEAVPHWGTLTTVGGGVVPPLLLLPPPQALSMSPAVTVKIVCFIMIFFIIYLPVLNLL